MNKQIRWLHGQMRGWVTQGVITQPQAEAIARLYPEPKAALPWGLIIFSGIGAVIIGLGVILLFVYNWQAIPKFAKLGLILGALIAAHAGGLHLFRKDDRRRQLGEALCVLGTMLYGAGIWLIAQIYHIEEHFPNGFLFWGVGALALAWAMPSVAQGALAALLLTIWGASEAFGFDAPLHWAPLLLLVGVGALACKARSRFLLVLVLAGFQFLLLANAGCSSARVVFPAALNISVLLVALGLIVRQSKSFPESAPLLSFFGWLGFFVVGFIFTFEDGAQEAVGWHLRAADAKSWWPLAVYGWGLFAAALAAWIGVAVLTRRRAAVSAKLSLDSWLLPLGAISFQLLALMMSPDASAMVVIIFNLILLAISAAWMAHGCRFGELKPLLLGSLVLVALVFARYFDLFDNLAARGLVFLVLGGVLFAEGFFYRRARQRQQEGGAEP